MTAPTPNAALAYRVTFTRIGRTHDVPALLATADGPNHLADQILAYARPHLLSRDVEVVFQEDMLSGWIFCGFRTGGTFTIEQVAEIFGPRPDGAPDQAWRECAHRADYDSAAHHERECPFHLGEVDENGQPRPDGAA